MKTGILTGIFLALLGLAGAATTDVVILQRDSTTTFAERTVTGSANLNRPLIFNASGVLTAGAIPAAALSDSTTVGRALVTAANAGAARTTLGLGTYALANTLAISDVINLQTTLDGKSATTHDHTGQTIHPSLVQTPSLLLMGDTPGTYAEFSGETLAGVISPIYPPSAAGTLATEEYVTDALSGISGGLPDTSGHSGEWLYFSGESVQWQALPSISFPSETGNAGKFLTTDGSTRSWAGVPSSAITDASSTAVSSVGKLAKYGAIDNGNGLKMEALQLVNGVVGQRPVEIVNGIGTSGSTVEALLIDEPGTLATKEWANTNKAPKGTYTTSGLTFATTARLLGRSTAGAGAGEEISIGSGLSLSTGVLSATGGSLTGSTGSVDNALLRADGTGGGNLQASDITISDATTSTTNNVAIVNAHSGQSNSTLVLAPKGTGALVLGPIPTGGGTTGNAPGASAFSAVLAKNAATQGATAADAVAIGNYTTANGSRAIGIGYGVISSGTASVAMGAAGTATGDYSFLGGFTGTASGTGATAFGVYPLANHYASTSLAAGRFAANGDSQTEIVNARVATTGNTATEAFLDGSANRFTISANSAWLCDVRIVAKQQSSTNCAAFVRRCTLCRDGSNNTALSGGGVITIGTDDNAPGWTGPTITADDTNESLKLQVTGASATNIRWSITVIATEVSY